MISFTVEVLSTALIGGIDEIEGIIGKLIQIIIIDSL